MKVSVGSDNSNNVACLWMFMVDIELVHGSCLNQLRTGGTKHIAYLWLINDKPA